MGRHIPTQIPLSQTSPLHPPTHRTHPTTPSLRRLVSEDILSLIHPEAIMVYVGKQRGFHTRTQDEIHDLLLHFTREGATVLR